LNNKDIRDLRDLSKAIEIEAPGKGFALFLEIRGRVSYASNCRRADVVKTFQEWLKVTKSVRVGNEPLAPEQDPFQSYDRIVLERQCVKTAEKLSRVGKVCLFFFDFGEGGNLAYWTNMENAYRNIQAWVMNERRRH